MTTDRRAQYVFPGFIALVAALVYANSLRNGFALDDNFVIAGNSRVHQLSDLGRIWLTPYWPTFGEELGLYRPLAIFWYALQWAAGGGAPWVYHATSLALHALVCVLGYLFLRRLVGSEAAFVGAMLFAVHPVHTEVVANVVGQAEMLAAAAMLGACLLHSTRPPDNQVGWGRRCALMVLFLIGVLAKESAIVLPALLVACDIGQRRVGLSFPAASDYARRMAVPLFLIAAAAVGYLALRVDVIGSIGGVDAAPQLPFLRHSEDQRILTAFRAWPEFVRLLFFPADLSSDYSPAVILPVETLTPMAMLGAILLALTVLFAAMTPWYPGVGLPAAWFLITVFPTSNLFVPIGVVVAERTLYSPSFAVALAAGFAWKRLAVANLVASWRRAALGAFAALVLIGAYRTWIRNPDWKDTEAVWSALVRDHPESYRAQRILASAEFRSGNSEAGEGYLRNAVHLWPYDAQSLNALAFEYLGRAEFEKALPLLERSRELVPFLSRTEILLANAYLGVGRPKDALEAITRADRLGADGNLTWPARAQAYERLGNLNLAIAAWRATLKQSFGPLWNYRALLARALARGGSSEAALAAVDSALAALSLREDSARSTLSRLRRAISDSCFQSVDSTAAEGFATGGQSRDECVDPLAEWRVVMPIVTVEQAARTSEGTS